MKRRLAAESGPAPAHVARASAPATIRRMEIDPRVPAEGALRTFLSSQRTLHDVVVAALALQPPKMIADVVVQDEYTHDVVLPWSDDLWLVYDTT